MSNTAYARTHLLRVDAVDKRILIGMLMEEIEQVSTARQSDADLAPYLHRLRSLLDRVMDI